jgi:aminopeptidase N
MLQLFDTLFGAYPFKNEKYGHAQFSWGGGMEHQTMSFMSYYSHDIRSHELAHSWFGNKITLATWHDIFLNEGFATYATGISFEHMINGFYWDRWKSIARNRIIAEPGGSVYVEDTTDVERIFSSRLSYYKGAYLLHMIRGIMGDAAFYEAIRNYVADPMLVYRFATLDDFIYHIESASEMDFTEFFDDWYYGEGYPIYGVNVAQMEEDGKIHVTIFQDQSHPSVEYFGMPVPIVVYGNGTSKTLICNNSYSGETYIFDNPGFVMDSVNFDPDQWILAKLDFLNLGIANGETHVLEIHPNPAVDEVHFFIPNKKVQEVEIFDVGGRIILSSKPSTINEFIEINVSELSAGVYFIKASADNKHFEGKFIKQ